MKNKSYLIILLVSIPFLVAPSSPRETRTITFNFGQPNDSYTQTLGWNLPWVPNQNLTWNRARRYPLTITMNTPPYRQIEIEAAVRQKRSGWCFLCSEPVLGYIRAVWSGNGNSATPNSVEYRRSEGGVVIPGSEDISNAFWLGCTKKGIVRGNYGKAAGSGSTDVQVILSVGGSWNGLSLSTNVLNPRSIQCVSN